jgi:cellulose biosynthesis protein BcsQ
VKLLLVANLAGGVGKTTSALAIGVAATEYGKKVLLVDADSKACLTFINGIENPRVTTKEFLSAEFPLETALIRTGERISLIPSSSRLSTIDMEKVISAEKFKELAQGFDLVIVDTASGINYLLPYFANFADFALIPSSQNILSLRGALHAKDFLIASGHKTTPSLLITLALNSSIAEQYTQIAEDFEVLEPAIQRDEAVEESHIAGKSVLTTANHSSVAAQYRELAYTLLEKLNLI